MQFVIRISLPSMCIVARFTIINDRNAEECLKKTFLILSRVRQMRFRVCAAQPRDGMRRPVALSGMELELRLAMPEPGCEDEEGSACWAGEDGSGLQP